MVSGRLAVGAFNLSLVRGCAHYCKLNSPREPRGLGVTAAGGTVICPPRAARVYVRERGGEGRSLSLSLGEKRSWNQMPVALDTGFMVGRATTTLRSLQQVINLASRDRSVADDANRYLSLPAAISLRLSFRAFEESWPGVGARRVRAKCCEI